MSTVSPAGSPPADPTLPYHTPRLEFFGHVASLTRGSFSSKMDANGTKTLQPAAFQSGSEDPEFEPSAEPWLEP